MVEFIDEEGRLWIKRGNLWINFWGRVNGKKGSALWIQRGDL